MALELCGTSVSAPSACHCTICNCMGLVALALGNNVLASLCLEIILTFLILVIVVFTIPAIKLTLFGVLPLVTNAVSNKFVNAWALWGEGDISGKWTISGCGTLCRSSCWIRCSGWGCCRSLG